MENNILDTITQIKDVLPKKQRTLCNFIVLNYVEAGKDDRSRTGGTFRSRSNYRYASLLKRCIMTATAISAALYSMYP